MLHLRVAAGDDAGEEVKTGQCALSIGRWLQCDLTLSDPRVSHTHGEILFHGPTCIYRDLLSRNGSLIRTGAQQVWLGPLTSEWVIGPGDEIVVGDTVIEVVEADPRGPRMTDLPGEQVRTLGTNDVHRPRASGRGPARLARFGKFLELHSFDPTSVAAAKGAVCEALLEVFPSAACVALVDLRRGASGEFGPEHIDAESVVWRHRHGAADVDSPPYSCHIVGQAYRRRRPLLYESADADLADEAESIRRARMRSCLCSPLWRAGEIMGFVHLYTAEGFARPFSRADEQLLYLLASAASLVLNNADSAQTCSQLRAVASSAQVVEGLAHDARATLESLGLNARRVEKAFPDLARNEGWREIMADFELLKFVATDTFARLSEDVRELEPRKTRLHPVVADALRRSERYFSSKIDGAGITLLNVCDLSTSALAAELMLTQALVNCVKNSVDALHGKGRPGTVLVSCSDDPCAEASLCSLSICDDAGGIPPAILPDLGRPFVTTKGSEGTGLGLHLVVDLVRRMGGVVRIATSTEAGGACPAGTVVSLCLPRPGAAAPSAQDVLHRPLHVLADYESHRVQVDPTMHGGRTP